MSDAITDDNDDDVLRRDACIDTFVKGATGWICCKILFIFLKDLDIVVGQAFDLINLLDRVVGSVAGELSSRMREHSWKRLVVAL